MVGYKIWYDTKHYIHKDTTNELDVKWTTNIEDAKSFPTWHESTKFFNDILGFPIFQPYDMLHIN